MSFIKKNHYYWSETEPIAFAEEVAIKLAKIHTAAALSSAAENVYHDIDIDWVDPYDYSAGLHGLRGDIDKESILNAYPLENIK